VPSYRFKEKKNDLGGFLGKNEGAFAGITALFQKISSASPERGYVLRQRLAISRPRYPRQQQRHIGGIDGGPPPQAQARGG
jgi:hypothetical protein